MGYNGHIICYTTTERRDAIGCVDRLMRRLQIDTIRSVSVYDEPDISWNNLLLELAGQDPEEPVIDAIGGPLIASDLQGRWPERGRIRAHCGPSPLAAPVSFACERAAKELASQFAPSASPTLCIGWHDIIDREYVSEPLLVDRAFLSVTLDGRSDPDRRIVHELRRRILELSEFRAFRAAIEEVVGPMKSCVLWT